MRIDEIDPGQKNDMTNPDNYGDLAISKLGYFVKLIEKDCSESLTAMKQVKQFLYRGIKQTTSSISNAQVVHGRSRNNRKSLAGFDEKQLRVDEVLARNGFIALRSNSIFCSGSMAEAKSYGALYMVFPLNGFSLTWAEHIDDLLLTNISPIDDSMIERMGFRGFDLAGAIDSGNEIYIHGEYYSFNSNKFYQVFNDYFFSL